MAMIRLCCPVPDCFNELEEREPQAPRMTLYCEIHGFKYEGQEKDIELAPPPPESAPEPTLRDRIAARVEEHANATVDIPMMEDQEWLNEKRRKANERLIEGAGGVRSVIDTMRERTGMQSTPPEQETVETKEHPETD